ncbi:MAG: hypothetical protein GXO22_04430 [Aquificae bacterium]|nr:hypothetical protein [Aquificota bacterium]
MIKKITKILGRIFISALIALLSITIIILIILLLITNHKIFLRYMGVSVQHDCQIEKGNFVCSYYTITSEKGLFQIKMSNLEGSIIFQNFLKDKPIFQAKVENLTGFYKYPKKKTKKKGSLLPIYTFYLASKFVNFELKKGSFLINLPKNIVNLDNINFLVKDSSIYNKKPILIRTDNRYTTHLSKFRIKLTEHKAFLEDLRASWENQIYISASGYISISKQMYLNALVDIPYFETDKTKIYNSKIFITGKKETRQKPIYIKFLTSTHRIKNEKESINAYDIRTFGRYTLKNLNHVIGDSTINISDVFVEELHTKKIDINTHISKKKDRYKGIGDIKIKTFQYRNYKLEDTYLNLSFEKEKTVRLNGTIRTQLLDADFFYSDEQTPIFKLETLYFELEKIVDFLKPKKRELFLIKGKTKLNLTYYPTKSLANAIVNGKDLNFFGITFKEGISNINIDVLKNSIDISGTTQSKNSRLFYTGTIKNMNLSLSLNYNNISLENLIFTKKFDFSTIVSGNGYIKGNILSPEVMLYGKSDQMRYKQIYLENLNYAVLYRDKKLLVVGEKEEENLTTNIFVEFLPFSMLVDIYGIDTDLAPINPYLEALLPKIFEKIKPKKATGNVKIKAQKNYWEVNLDVEKGSAFLVPIKDTIYGYGKGKISKEDTNLTINFYNQELTLLKKKISVKGKFELLNKDFFIEVYSKKLEGFDRFEAVGFLYTELKNEKVLGNLWIEGKKDSVSFTDEILATGNLKKIGGVSLLSVKQNGYVALDSTFNYLVNILDDKIQSHIFTEKISLHIFTEENKETLSLLFNKIDINTTIEKQKLPKIDAVINSITVKKENLKILYSEPIHFQLIDKTLIVKPFKYAGILEGYLKRLTYNIENNILSLYTEGNIGKDIIPELLQFFSLKGDIKYQILYEDVIENINKNIFVKLYSNDLIIRTPYVIGTINIDKFLIEYKKELKIDIVGKTISSLFGENPIQIQGWAKLNPLTYNLKTFIEMLSVKYENLFVGTLNSNLDIITTQNQNHIIKGNVSVSGRSKLPMSFLTEKRTVEEKPPIFEKISLDINVTTFSPIYIYSNWGNVYAEASLHITGTLAKPILNGEINITYGKIYIAKNLYNVDFINIRIIDNKPFVNARLSTNIAQTFIYLNVTGPIDDLQFEYVSTPPKTKEEILAILFLKETPAALAELPFFTLVGKIIKTIFPASPEKGGIFQTGFEISINPKYSPIQGIIASIYARKSITRRLYIAISRPILQTVTEFFGWYELGFKITERTAIVFRQYENNITETEITFSLPFDF